MPFVPPSSLAIVGTVTVTDTLAESLLATIAANTTGAAKDATVQRVNIATSDTALALLAPDVEEFDYTTLLKAVNTNLATLNTTLGSVVTNTAQLATTQPVSVASLPLETGAATEATLKRVERAVDDMAMTIVVPEILEDGS